MQKHEHSEVYYLNFVEVADVQLLRIESLAMCLGCHDNCCSWYSAVLTISVLDCKVFIYN